jgi:GTPase Era involved in 16S rRNA processing
MPKRTTFKKYNATQEEPMLSSENPETQIIEALNWYNYNKTKDDAKKYFLEYLEKHVDHKNVTTISSLDSVSVNNNIGWLCRIFMTNPTTFPQKYIKNIEEAKDKVLQVVVENEPQEPELT